MYVFDVCINLKRMIIKIKVWSCSVLVSRHTSYIVVI